MTKDCLFGYQTRFGYFSDRCILVYTGILTHGMLVRIGEEKGGEGEGVVEE